MAYYITFVIRPNEIGIKKFYNLDTLYIFKQERETIHNL